MKKAAKKSVKQRKRNGQVVRLSQEILDMFPREGKESFDQAFRRKLGFDSKKGKAATDTYWLLTKPRPKLFDNRAKALGASIMSMVGKGQKRKEMPKKVVVVK